MLSCVKPIITTSEDEKEQMPASFQTNTADVLRASAGLSVSISVDYANKIPHVTATASGTVLEVITDEQIKTLGLTDAVVKAAVNRYFGKTPNDAYLKSPTPWDLFKKYNWEQTSFTMTAVKATVISVKSVPSIISTQEFENKTSHVATYTASMSKQVTSSITSSWSQTTTTTVGTKITANSKVTGIGGEFSMSVSVADQQGGSDTHSTTLSSGSTVQITLNPGEKAFAHLTASIGTVIVRVTYKLKPQGKVAVNYNPTFKGHHFWGLPVANVMAADNITMGGVQTQDIEIKCFSSSKVTVTDQHATQFMSMLAAPFEDDIKEDSQEKEILSDPQDDFHIAVPLHCSPDQADR